VKPHNKGFLYVWTVGYWENGKLNVPKNCYHLKMYCENIFKFEQELSQKYPEKNWVHISERARNEIKFDLDKISIVSPIDGIENSNKETTWNFES